MTTNVWMACSARLVMLMDGWVVNPHGHVHKAHVQGPPKGLGGPHGPLKVLCARQLPQSMAFKGVSMTFHSVWDELSWTQSPRKSLGLHV